MTAIPEVLVRNVAAAAREPAEGSSPGSPAVHPAVAIVVPALKGVPLLPLYYVLVSLAAWRGLALLFHPLRWNKTEHGLARTSRTGKLTGGGEAPGPPGLGAGQG